MLYLTSRGFHFSSTNFIFDFTFRQSHRIIHLKQLVDFLLGDISIAISCHLSTLVRRPKKSISSFHVSL